MKMNYTDSLVLHAIICGQGRIRDIARETGLSIGNISQRLQSMTDNGILSPDLTVIPALLSESRPRNLILLAAGPGLRSAPLTREVPKAFLRVKGETLIERLIRQAKDVGIENVIIVAGYHKEAFEPLVDKYGVRILVNPKYAQDDNLGSFLLARSFLGNSYISPADLYFGENPFRKYEFVSWYAVRNPNGDANITVGSKSRITKRGKPNYRAIGLAYIASTEAASIIHNASAIAHGSLTPSFWEETLFGKEPLTVYAREMNRGEFYDVNSFEDLRQADPDSPDLMNGNIRAILSAFGANLRQISDVRIMKKGMTNRSFLFTYKNKDYIMRVPGEGTESLINRKQEFAVYQAIKDFHISDDVRYMDPETGIKITEYLPGAHNCDPNNLIEVQKCMGFLKAFHKKGLSVPFRFDIFEQIEYYESLWNGTPSAYSDYVETKASVLSLKPFVAKLPKRECLTHIDAVPDNFLIGGDGSIRLIDWEYAANQDPHVDLAMFSVYAGYERKEIDQLIDFYFQDEPCDEQTRLKIYAYVAMCGLLWSNWCEYKQQLGIEFGEYSLNQYRYAKDYSRLVLKALGDKPNA